MKKVLLYNPPGGLWLRGEARCEQDLDNATAYTVTAPTTLCYLGAIFKEHDIEPKIVDCPVEQIDQSSFEKLASKFSPDMLILNASVLNLIEDLKTAKALREALPSAISAIILPYYNSVPLEKIDFAMFESVDFIVVGEMEAVAYDLAGFIAGVLPVESVRGVIRVDHTNQNIEKSDSIAPVDLEILPFPARDLIKNELYLRPDVGRPMASIVDGRGCPSSCIYCLAPITTGKRVRKRSADSVITEIKECVERYGIRDFLFRSDAFTINKGWVIEFCSKVVEQQLEISWAANSKTSSFDFEMACAMKQAGCFLVEFGVESGSDNSLKLQKKGTTVEQALNAVAAAKEAGLLTYGTVLIGFPWENKSDIEETEAFIRKLDLDFIEIHVVAPYMGTELYDMMLAEDLIDGDAVGHDMIRNPAVKGTRFLTREELLEFRSRFLKRFYLRPIYVIRTLRRISSITQFMQYARYGTRLMKNLIGMN